MKREALDSTKMKRLARRLDLPRYAAVGLMESLWKLAERDAPQGDLGKLTNEDIAVALDWRGDENALVDALVACGWLDADLPGVRLWVHDWHQHAEDAVDMRLARAGLLYANGTMPHMRKMSVKEREQCQARYDAQHAVRTNTASVRTEVHAVPLPSPSPIPSPSPSLVERAEPMSPAPVNLNPAALEIACAHPAAVARQLRPAEVAVDDVVVIVAAIRKEALERGVSQDVAAAALLGFTRTYAAAVAVWPPGEQRFVMAIAKFFTSFEYRKDPETWRRDGTDRQQHKQHGTRPRTAAEERHRDGLSQILDAFPELAGNRVDGDPHGADEGELRDASPTGRMGGQHPVTLDGDRGQAWAGHTA